MNTVLHKKTITTVLTSCLFTLFLLLAMPNVSDASRVSIGIGTSYGSDVVYVPGHWQDGYWIPGQYVEYAGPAPGPDYVWFGGGFGGGHHWHHGHWGHHH